MTSDTSFPVQSVMIHSGYAVGQRLLFSVIHLESAALFARRAYELEQLLPGGLNYATGYQRDVQHDVRYTEHRAYVTGAVFAAVASIDAGVTEPFIDAVEKDPSQHSPVEAHLASRWSSLEKDSINTRAGGALKGVGSSLKQVSSWKSANALIGFRNSLSHYTGGTIWTYSELQERLVSQPSPIEQEIIKQGVTPNPLGAGLVFPYNYLGHSCAAWTVSTSYQFIVEFSTILGRKSPFKAAEHLATRLQQLPPFSSTP